MWYNLPFLIKNMKNLACEITLLKYEQIRNNFEPLQVTLPYYIKDGADSISIVLSDHFLVYNPLFWDAKLEDCIYHWEGPTDPFTYLQYINAAEYLNDTSWEEQLQLALEKDILVVNAPLHNKVLIVWLKNGY